MPNIPVENLKTDVLVVGAGGAGLRAAIEAAKSGVSVIIASRSPIGRGGLTATANGGYHAAMWPGDSPEIHANDMIKHGNYLNDRDLVRTLADEAPARARELESFGVAVNWDIPPKPAEPEMTYPRSLFIPGKEMSLVMGKMLIKIPNIRILEDFLLLKFLNGPGGVTGALFFDIRKGNIAALSCKAVVLASGSYGEIYPGAAQEPLGVRTGSTGIGHITAAETGADLVDMEMMQFGMVPVDPVTVLAMRCLPEGPVINAAGETFLPKGKGPYSFDTAHAVWKEYNEGRGPVYMDLRNEKPPAGSGRYFAAVHRGKHLGEIGATPYKRKVQVGLGALFAMGGIHINARCETGVPGLFAAGEVAASVHGGRRISGNALPEIIVFGARAGQYAAEFSKKHGVSHADITPNQVDEIKSLIEKLTSKKDGQEPQKLRDAVKKTIGQYAYIERDKNGLTKALEELNKIEKELIDLSAGSIMQYNLNLVCALDLHSLVKISKVVCMAALTRDESRGFHYRSDFPKEKKKAEHTVVRINKGEFSAGTKPVRI